VLAAAAADPGSFREAVWSLNAEAVLRAVTNGGE
jgi:hypothetical protein